MEAALSPAIYRPSREAISRYVTVRGISYHVREWGSPEGQPLVLLHGAFDSSISFQFLVDALQGDWWVIAPDWRGHGLSDWASNSYWTSDFLCDLDGLISAMVPEGGVHLVAHSMGGTFAALYAGLRPQRVTRLLLVDSLGELPCRTPVQISEVLTRLLDKQAAPAEVRSYDSTVAMTHRLLRRNGRLLPSRARFLAEGRARRLPDGKVAWAYDPSFTGSWPSIHTLAEWGECWRLITAPVLCAISSDPRPRSATGQIEHLRERSQYFRDLTLLCVPETGHNIHHDAPEALAHLLEDFFGS